MENFTTFLEEMKQCSQCFDQGHEITPGAIFSGSKDAQAMIIGQAPGRTEVEAGRPFNASSGRRLFQWLAEVGWDESEFRAQQYMTAVTKCYPGKNSSGQGDRVPSKKEQELCRPFLDRELGYIRPKLIIPVGRLAISKFWPGFRTLSNVIGTCAQIPWEVIEEGLPVKKGGVLFHHELPSNIQEACCWVVPLPHPSGASLWPNQAQNKALIQHAIEKLRELGKEIGI